MSFQSDAEVYEQACMKVNKLKEDKDVLYRDMESAKDKFATGLYDLQASEKDYCDNIFQYALNLQEYLKNSLKEVNEIVPQIQEHLATNKNRRIFGESLETHLSTSGEEV